MCVSIFDVYSSGVYVPICYYCLRPYRSVCACCSSSPACSGHSWPGHAWPGLARLGPCPLTCSCWLSAGCLQLALHGSLPTGLFLSTVLLPCSVCALPAPARRSLNTRPAEWLHSMSFDVEHRGPPVPVPGLCLLWLLSCSSKSDLSYKLQNMEGVVRPRHVGCGTKGYGVRSTDYKHKTSGTWSKWDTTWNLASWSRASADQQTRVQRGRLQEESFC